MTIVCFHTAKDSTCFSITLHRWSAIPTPELPVLMILFSHAIDNHKNGFSDVTLVTQLTVDRLNRLPYLLRRWRGPISCTLFVQEDEMEKAAAYMSSIVGRRVIFNVYIPRVSNTTSAFFVDVKSKIGLKGNLYPINELRDFAIESIETTHYLLLDVDVFPSNDLYHIIHANQELLENHSNCLLLELFEYDSCEKSAYGSNYMLL